MVSGQCLVETRCKQDGGAIDCNGHGTCYYEQDKDGVLSPKCECDKGFADDGKDWCGKCQDSMFDYPNCWSSRRFIVEQSEHDCDSLQTKMPTYLYKEQISKNLN